MHDVIHNAHLNLYSHRAQFRFTPHISPIHR